MNGHILISGGAGFIGSHLADELLANGYTVRVLDNLSPQVHGDSGERPPYLSPEAEVIVGDIRDPRVVRKALSGIDGVFHFAAAVGVGQSMYQISHYTEVNNLGTAVLLEELIKHPVVKLVVASSMSVYGEGLYRNEAGAIIHHTGRTLGQLERNQWEPQDSNGTPLSPVPTSENKKPSLMSVYALSKYHQEQLCLIIGNAYRIPTTALRFFNVYGPRQSLSNPYTGVLAIFASRYLNGRPPLVFEDGRQMRDFVSVYDVCRACRLALESERAAGEIINVGSGNAYTVLDVAYRMAVALDAGHIEPSLTGNYRVGDIRHCFADIGKAREILGYEPRHSLDEGMRGLAQWLQGRDAYDSLDDAYAELTQRGLTV